MNDEASRCLERLAEQQGALFTRSQAYACGFSKRTVENRISSGRWHVVGSDVLRVAGVPVSAELKLRAATLSLRASVVSHESAAEIHGLTYLPTGRLTVAVPVRATHRFPDVRVRELTDLHAEHVQWIRGLPVTSATRTAVDLAAVLRPGRLARCLGDGIASGVLHLDDLQVMHASLARQGKPGFAALRQILLDLGQGTVVSMSTLERRFVELVAASDQPDPVAQFRPPWWQGRRGIADYDIPDARNIIEIDGRR
jgi:hypothetical protein